MSASCKHPNAYFPVQCELSFFDAKDTETSRLMLLVVSTSAEGRWKYGCKVREMEGAWLMHELTSCSAFGEKLHRLLNVHHNN